MIFSIPEYKKEAASLSRETKMRIGRAKLSRFLSGDLYVKIASPVRNKKCYVYGGTGDGELFKTLLLAHTLKKEGARVVAIIPYLAYARQDMDIKGESFGAKLIGSLLEAAGVEKVIAIDVHSRNDTKAFPIPLVSLNPYGFFAAEVRKEKFTEPAIIAPDEGALDNARNFQKSFLKKTQGDIISFHKKRFGEEVQFSEKHGKLFNEAIIVDDILDTGGTVLRVLQMIAGRKAKIVAVISHALFSGNNWKKMWPLGVKRIYTTDTLGKRVNDRRVIYLPAHKILAQYLKSAL
jgi:ribose-phosphate pyrophosphokinase